MTRECISLEGYSVTDHEFRYLQALCDGPKHPTDIAAELAADSLLIEHDGGRYALTEDGRAIFC